jgi:1,4-dihydroxy-2-naphthoate octaprenyltransferase
MVLAQGDDAMAISMKGVRAWLRLGRPKFLLYSALLYGLGATLAVLRGARVTIGAYLFGQLFVSCVHLMTHYCNEYFDYEADRANPAPTAWTGGSRVLVHGLLRPSVSLGTAFVLLFIGVALAIAMPSGDARWICVCMIALAWFYTAPPLQLNYRGMGELSVATVLHVLCPALAFRLQAGHLDPLLLLALFPSFVLQIVRMMVMNLVDYEGDRVVGKRTLVLTLGPRRAAQAYAVGQVLAYGSLPLLVALGLPLAVALGVALTLPLSVWQVRRLLAGAYRDPAMGNNVVFWASTHVALVVVATSFGVVFELVVGHVRPSALSVLVPLVYLSFMGPQIWKNRALAS